MADRRSVGFQCPLVVQELSAVSPGSCVELLLQSFRTRCMPHGHYAALPGHRGLSILGYWCNWPFRPCSRKMVLWLPLSVWIHSGTAWKSIQATLEASPLGWVWKVCCLGRVCSPANTAIERDVLLFALSRGKSRRRHSYRDTSLDRVSCRNRRPIQRYIRNSLFGRLVVLVQDGNNARRFVVVDPDQKAVLSRSLSPGGTARAVQPNLATHPSPIPTVQAEKLSGAHHLTVGC